VEFYHNFSRLLGVDSYGLTPQQLAEIVRELNAGFETGALTPPPIDSVPFEKAVDAYTRVAAGRAKVKQVLIFDWQGEEVAKKKSGVRRQKSEVL
jgi:hypothetical protein